MAQLVPFAIMDYFCNSGALVSSLHDSERPDIPSNFFLSPQRRAIHLNALRARPVVILLPSRIAVAHISVDFPVDLSRPKDVREKRAYPAVVGGCSVCFLFILRIETAGLHPADGASFGAADRKRALPTHLSRLPGCCIY